MRRKSTFPIRRDAAFTDANDHNPFVREECPGCHGCGKALVRKGTRKVLVVCPSCGGRGTTLRVVRFFPTARPEAVVTPDPGGWIRCPGCGSRFTIDDPNQWTGRPHVGRRQQCGQKLRLMS